MSSIKSVIGWGEGTAAKGHAFQENRWDQQEENMSQKSHRVITTSLMAALFCPKVKS